MPPHSSESPAKKQTKWSSDEDRLIIELRQSGMKWEDISKKLPGRSAISCRLHYQNYLEKRCEWDEEKKNKLARLYERNRFKSEMWAGVAGEMGMPWRAVEAMHWHLGDQEMTRRAGTTPFQLAASASEGGSRSSSRHTHSHSQGNISRDSGTGKGYSRGNTVPSSRPLASRRESVPPHLSIYAERSPESYGYPQPLAPIKTRDRQPPSGVLPGIAELTTGVAPYSTPAYSLPVPSASPVLSATASPGPYMSPIGYPSMEPTGSKRRRSPDTHLMSPDMNRRRHLDLRAEYYEKASPTKYEHGR
ncbi:uncharacterized protein GGS25DRAFT_175809 [Hypoxylon fragiforme]|uniref:uncharacterized protein n=1 Tax=Hypoxylon fragiforme TaxID=63214 RepID=UPI0020C6CC28|nr:uncharacterized protein GGS25DRAFT_175809 [Hypoxylon fragiforme]KAI2610970.1 hypothetical protein GGS25DRAFT_175809 [Hypoxylon fragiforme]